MSSSKINNAPLLTNEEFEKVVHDLSFEFCFWWWANGKKDPEVFPEKLELREWFDQFLIYIGSEECSLADK